MITTVTLNSAIDKTYYLGGFGKGGVYRVARQIAEPGGKGNNVAKVARLLGAEVAASGFSAGANGAFIEERLVERGIRTAFVAVKGESRICLNIIDEADGSSTELLEQGPTVEEADVTRLKSALHGLAASSSVVVMSGSLPQGVNVTLYAELIETIRSAGALAYLDTSGGAFGAALAAKPDFVKPNEHELAAWVGRELRGEDDIVQAAADLAGRGIGAVCACRAACRRRPRVPSTTAARCWPRLASSRPARGSRSRSARCPPSWLATRTRSTSSRARRILVSRGTTGRSTGSPSSGWCATSGWRST